MRRLMFVVTPGKKMARALGTLIVSSAVFTLLTGCALLEGPTPDTPPRETPAAPEIAIEFFPEGSAADNLPYFSEVLRSYGASEQPITGAPVVDAVTGAGFDRGAMQVSFDATKTGLVADNIFVSVRMGADCLIGQLVTQDRSTFAEVEPAVGPNQDICLIGQTRPIDW